jgi:5'-phosphate synthase pdxT subunit
MKEGMIVGVMGYQGGFDPHLACLNKLQIKSRKILTVNDFENLSGLILPGGESSVQYLYCKKQPGIYDAIVDFVKSGKPVLATCAGVILLSNYKSELVTGFGLLDVDIERNAYGRQIDSGIKLSDNNNEVFFIRAPVINKIGNNVEILDSYQQKPILVRQNNIYGATYHPECLDDPKGNIINQIFFSKIS